MSNQIQEKEKAVCKVCGKEFSRSAAYMPTYRRTVCSGKCRLIDWADRSKKEMKRTKTEGLCKR